MELQEAIEQRRSIRSLTATEISDETVEVLASAARLAPSCYNKQPWRYVFVRDTKVMNALRNALSEGNEWAYQASMYIGIVTSEEMDCVAADRKYYLFDTGMATALLLLKATELGLVAHPIAGFSGIKAKKAMGIPSEMELITLLVCGKPADELNPNLTDKQKASERQRPDRLGLSEFVYFDRFQEDK